MQIVYEAGSLSPRALQDGLALVVQDVVNDANALHELESLGASPEDLREGISFTPASSGIDAATAQVIVAFAPLLVHIGKSFWDDIVLPKLKARFGDDALGEVAA